MAQVVCWCVYNYAVRLCIILSVVSSLCNRMRVEMVIRSSNASADYLQPPLHFSALLKPYPSCIMTYGMNNMDMPMQERICCCNKILSPELQLLTQLCWKYVLSCIKVKMSYLAIQYLVRAKQAISLVLIVNSPRNCPLTLYGLKFHAAFKTNYSNGWVSIA